MRKHYERILHDSESRVQRYLDIQILDENSPFCGGFPKATAVAEYLLLKNCQYEILF